MIAKLKKIKFVVLFAVGLILFTSCQKEVDFTDATGANADFKVKTYTETVTSATSGNSSQTFRLTYDASNRIVSVVDTVDASNKFVYTYNSGTYAMELFIGGVLNIHEDFFLNSIPLIDSTSQYNDTGDTTLEKNIYNSSNQITQTIDYDYTIAGGAQLYGTTDYTYDASGNIIQESDNSTGTVYTYQYSTEINTINVGLIYEPQNKNLIQKTTIVEGSSTVVINHTYTFDSSHRVTSERQEYSTGDVVVKTYTY